ncbi:MAG: hypothetical protein FWE40_08895 [Oscillospiraceae bacterium]|nr:hypothetical protein [Oscillospiraceae bacterium]
MELITMIVAIASAVSAIAACLACFISLRNATRSAMSTSTNHCNERFSFIVKEIDRCVASKDEIAYGIACKNLFELLGHEFLLWQNGLLPDKIFYRWNCYTASGFRCVTFSKDGETYSMYRVWQDMRSSDRFFYTNCFVKYVDKLFKADIKSIKKLKRTKGDEYECAPRCYDTE